MNDKPKFIATPMGKMPFNWKKHLLSDISEFITKGATPTTKGFKWQDSGITFLRSECVSELGYSESGVAFISKEAHDSMERSKIIGGDILISITGNVGRIAVYPLDNSEGNINQHIARVRIVKKEIANRKFIYYQLNQKNYRNYYLGIITGAAYPQLSLKQIRETSVYLPSLQTQKRIADILSAYDDLIENNLKRIKLLEQAAQNIYKEWFVNLRFPGHENTLINEETGLPQGWKNLKFGDVFSVQNGYAFKSKDYRKSGVPVLRTRDYSSSFFINISDPIFLPEEFSISHKKYFVKELDFLLIMVGASIGSNGLVLKKDLPALQNQNQWAIRVKSEYSLYEYFKIYCVKSIIDSLLMKRTGAARDFFRASFIKEMVVQIPNKDLVKHFTKKTKPCIEQINLLLTQNQKLKAARDILLPRLMNRTIEV